MNSLKLGSDTNLRDMSVSEQTSSSMTPSVFSTFSDPETPSSQRRLSFDKSRDDTEPGTDKESDAATLTNSSPTQDNPVARLWARALTGKKIVDSHGIPQTPRVTDELTLLHVVASTDQLAFAKRSLEADQDPNILYQGQLSPLYLAVQADNLPMVKILLTHGADVELVGSEKRYPLSQACKQGNFQIVEILLEKGADPNVTTSTGVTPLVSSIFCENLSIVEALLDNGAKTDTRCNGMTALHWAASKGNSKIVRSLIQHSSSIQSVSEKYGAPLDVAATRGNLEAMRTLLRAGTEIDFISGTECDTALHACVRNGKKDATELLLQYGADIDARDGKDIPPWLYAIQTKRADILEVLLRQATQGFDLERTYTEIKTTGLQLAALRNHPASVAVLLKKGANPLNGGFMGHLPLALAENGEVRRLLNEAAKTWSARV